MSSNGSSPDDSPTLRDRVIFITGGAGGIGTAIAASGVKRGAHIVVMDVDDVALSALEERAPRSLVALRGSVLDEGDLVRAVELVHQKFGRLDCLMNLAGGSRLADGELCTSSPDEWRRVIELDLFGTMMMCRAMNPLLVLGDHASIVNVSSIATRRSVPVSGYAAAKAGIEGFTLSLVSQTAESGVRANTVCLGPLATPRLLHRRATLGQGHSDLAPPSQVVELFLFLAGAGASCLNGAVILADGGRSLV